jgi:predicted esterase
MRPRAAVHRLIRLAVAALALQLGTFALSNCASENLPPPPHPDPYRPPPPPSPYFSPASALVLAPGRSVSPPPPPVAPDPSAEAPPSTDANASAQLSPQNPEPAADSADAGHCASAPQLLPNGAVPPAPAHAPLGENVEIPGDRPVYVLPGNAGDPRVIIYLHGMCGDVTAADYFRDAVRAHGTLIALRGDTACDAVDRFKWREDASKIQARVQSAFKRVNALRGGALDLERALLFGYSQGADRAEKVATLYPQRYPRIVLGGAPMKASPQKLARAERVAFLGGELETTENMHAGADALSAAGIACRFFTLDCAYHGYFGSNAEAQLGELLDWAMQP